MIFEDLKRKLLITKIIEGNISDVVTYWFYILLLSNFVFDFKKKKIVVNLMMFKVF